MLYVSTGRDLPSFESDTGQASLDVNINTEDLTAGQIFSLRLIPLVQGRISIFVQGNFEYFTHTPGETPHPSKAHRLLSRGKGLSEEAVRKKKAANDDDTVDGEKFEYVDHGYFVVAPHISFLLFFSFFVRSPPIDLNKS